MPDTNAKQQLNFELPSQKATAGHHQSKPLIWLLLFILMAVSVNIGISLKKPDLSTSPQNSSGLTADQEKKLALKLEKLGLYASSARAWIQYISKADLADKETALIWYRIGKLYQDDHAFENALESYYRSESFASVDTLSSEISIRIQECLESMGKFAAMRHELIDRVSVKQSEGMAESSDSIVAEIGMQKITAAELDRHIEGTIDQQITMMAPYLPEDERNKQKETLLKQFSNPSTRMMYLNQFVVQEVLYRKARENKLSEDGKVRALIDDQERTLLARLVMEKEYESRIKLTRSDLETYYEAHKDEFMKDEQQQSFETVKNNVYKTIRAKKEQDIQQQFLTQLKDQYDVVIHQSEFSEKLDLQPETKSGNN